jgi:hypothetical protein
MKENLVKKIWDKGYIYKILLIVFYPFTLIYLIWFEIKNPNLLNNKDKNIVFDLWTRSIYFKIILIFFYPITLSYLFWVKIKLEKNIKAFVLISVWGLLLYGYLNESNKTKEIVKVEKVIEKPLIKENNNEQESNKKTEIIKPIDTNLPLSSYISTKLEKYKDAEISIWRGDNVYFWGGNDVFIKEDNGPFDQIIVNFSKFNQLDCYRAKTVSYEIIKDIYDDKKIQNEVSRVLVSIPYNLRVSMGYKEAIVIAENKGFKDNGPTIFWNVMEKYSDNKELEIGDYEDRTWGKYLDKCKK